MIDAKELEDALDAIERMPRGRHAELILSAARAHLATLPRYKDVEVVRWCTVSPAGNLDVAHYDDEGEARCACPDGWSVVRLTGTARVRV